MTQPFSWLECAIWFGTGVLLAVLAIVAEFRERRKMDRAHVKEKAELDRKIAELQRTIDTGQAHQSGMLQASLHFQGIALEELVKARKAQSESAFATAERLANSANEQIITLSQDWRHVTREQRWAFGRALPNVVPEFFQRPINYGAYAGVRITFGSTLEAQNYAEELYRLFGEHAISTSMFEERTSDSLNLTGLKVLVADVTKPTENDKRTMALLNSAQIQYQVQQGETAFPNITVLLVGKSPLI